ncbi:glucose-6-phosphate dehydrogenase [Subtercola boreus]|uniref:Glucose-6-phosphate 1-dehydrogenase n=1 Tax=Subtercola boreus TaxID=120213 RepID=A0A3E0WF73_9MICO|nr:glucose-6-phosphate dehydrogenase [Subtercola boreus]RFA22687.1 glucose-6-phosphate dehydrogenase [Subtercola boreus]RFA23042.1 glucose-6-phosphate dehydrogenase [Subtercola boreus]RFA28795.1 glucose-6-phosphate dehydrogenase [Subtercola boreus]
MSQMIGTLVILGASGDLSARLLLPGLAQLLTGEPDRTLTLIGAGVEQWTDEDWHKVITTSFAEVNASGETVAAILKGSHYFQADVTKPDDLQKLLDACDGVPAIYFALPPAVAAAACAALETVKRPDGLTLALEKPFGTDEQSAIALNELLLKLVPEEQIHRVDHFLGRSTVLNLLGLRFANRIFEPVWNAEHIEKIEIIYDEQLALEGRARYYDKAGALVDMIQSHLLQVMAVVAMEPPSTLKSEDLRDAKQLVLRATQAWQGDPIASSRRARYTAGEVQGRQLPSYVDESGVDPSRETETLAEVTFEINTWRWAGIPFTLRSGKALAERRREIVITFRPARQLPVGLKGHNDPTVLRVFLAPDEMSLEININGPGDPYELERISLDAHFGDGQLLAYREVLAGILDGDSSLSVRGDSAVEGWRIVAPIVDAWKRDEVPIDDYRAGSEGPTFWPRI